jgi:hypothetical protein
MTREPLPFTTLLLCFLAPVLILGALVGVVGPQPANASASDAATAEVHAIPRYSRDEFGDGWADLDHDCQDTRNEVLIRDLVGERLDPEGCKVLSGTLHGAYTGATIDFHRGRGTSNDVQIDHITPLSWAWHHGAWRWSDERREAFANDPRNLLAVDGPTNASKSDQGPASWMPPNIAAHCFYAQSWTEVLRAYDLTPNRADSAALAAVLADC